MGLLPPRTRFTHDVRRVRLGAVLLVLAALAVPMGFNSTLGLSLTRALAFIAMVLIIRHW